jgi:hypothetical protein
MPEEPHVHGECVSLLEYIKELRKADLESLNNAKASMEKRLEGMNEFRAQLKDQTAGFITRTEYQARHDGLDTKSMSRHDQLEARLRGVEKLVWMGLGAVVMIQIIFHFLK